MGDVQGAVRRRVITDKQQFSQVMNSHDRTLPAGNQMAFNANRRIGKNGPPAFTDWHNPGQADPGGMDADRFFLFRPVMHQLVSVSAADGLIKRRFEVFRRGKGQGLAHGAIHFWQASATCIGESFCRQSR